MLSSFVCFDIVTDSFSKLIWTPYSLAYHLIGTKDTAVNETEKFYVSWSLYSEEARALNYSSKVYEKYQ